MERTEFRQDIKGSLQGIGNCELFNQGKEKIEIKEYAIEVLKGYLTKRRGEIRRRDDDDEIVVGRNFYILSTNWSPDLMLGCLNDLKGLLRKEDILSNNLIFDTDDDDDSNKERFTTGMMKCDVLSAIDKLKIFNNLETPKNTLSAYIGDSETDLPCLYFDDTIVVVDDIVDVADVVDFDVFVIEIEIADFEVEIEIGFVD
nr:14550_t:CDS:2 [Entrophospora candida]